MPRSVARLALATLIALAPWAGANGLDEALVHAAQRAWGDGIVAIGAAHRAGGDQRAVAADHVATLYAYDLGPVLFKPTKAAADPFRETFGQALSYFVTGEVPEDHGFALQPWTAVHFENHAVVVVGDVAYAMGHYRFTDPTGAETVVEYSFGYVLDAAGALRIVLHHSSLPYAPHGP